MSNKVFPQNQDDKKGHQPGGPCLIQILFNAPVPMPDKAAMTAVIGKAYWASGVLLPHKKMAGFAALEHIAEFRDARAPVQMMVMGCSSFIEIA